MKNYIFLLTVLIAFTTSVFGSFDTSNLADAFPSKGAVISAQLDNSLYIFGGENSTDLYSNDLYKLTLADNIYNWETVPQTNAPNGTYLGQGYITSDNKSMVIMEGKTYADVQIPNSPFQVYTYNFASQTWTAKNLSTDDIVTLSSRESFSATYNPETQKTYVLGGHSNTDASIFNDFWLLDANFKVTTLSTPNVGRYAHTATLTSDGKIVVLGGIIPSSIGNVHVDMQSALVYNTEISIWTIVNLSGTSSNDYPIPRSGHAAFINSNGQIVIFGGEGGTFHNPQYLQDIAILDTKTWAWTIPTISGTPPSIRSFVTGGFLDGNTLTIAFGEASNYATFNDINVYDLSTNSWLQQYGELLSNSSSGGSSPHSSNGESSPHNSNGVSKGLIAGVTVAGVVVILIIAFLLWKFKFGSVLKDRGY